MAPVIWVNLQFGFFSHLRLLLEMQHVSARQVTAVLPCLRMRTYQVVLRNVLRLQPRGPVASSTRLRRQMATSAAAGVEQATTQPNVKGSPLQVGCTLSLQLSILLLSLQVTPSWPHNAAGQKPPGRSLLQYIWVDGVAG